jgi:hypothetical protein
MTNKKKLPFEGYCPFAIYDKLDLSPANRKKLLKQGFVAYGDSYYHPTHWRPDSSGDVWFYESTFQSLTAEAAAYGEDGPPEDV